jgi:hypothetical protein
MLYDAVPGDLFAHVAFKSLALSNLLNRWLWERGMSVSDFSHLLRHLLIIPRGGHCSGWHLEAKRAGQSCRFPHPKIIREKPVLRDRFNLGGIA